MSLTHNPVLEDFDYGAVAVSQRLEELGPDVLILVGAEPHDRAPGSIVRRVVTGGPFDADLAQQAVEGAATGYVATDLVVDVLRALGPMPSRIVTFEIEPGKVGPSPELSPGGKRSVETAANRIRDEIEATALYLLCEALGQSISDSHLEASGVGRQIREILNGVSAMEDGGPWGGVITGADRLRDLLVKASPAGLRHLDSGLVWALLEELDRLRNTMTLK